MLHLLTGSDDYTKKEFITDLAKQKSADLDYLVFSDEAVTGSLSAVGDLFGKKRIYIFTELNSAVLTKCLEQLITSSNEYVIAVASLDKRLNATKQLLAEKRINVKEFDPPQGAALEKWIDQKVKEKGSSISPKVAKVLVTRLGLAGQGFNTWDQKQANLVSLNAELDKLAMYDPKAGITEDAIYALIPDAGETKVFQIIDTLGAGQKKLTISAVDAFFNQNDGVEEKTKAIQLGALLADQFRSILLIKSYVELGIPDKEIVARSGFKPGRIAIMKKLLSKFETKLLIATLKKLSSFDAELKSSSVPPRVMLDLIITQLG